MTEENNTNWTIEKLIECAQTMDRTREYQDAQERIRTRKLAFDARKWARTKKSIGDES